MTPVARAWAMHDPPPTDEVAAHASRSIAGDRSSVGAVAHGDPPIATVNGRPIPRRRVVELLLKSHGPRVLDDLIVLDAAVAEASRLGLTVTQADIDREYRDSLRQLADPLGKMVADDLDAAEAERLLEAVLAERNIARDEYALLVRRNAYLRKIAEAHVRIDDDDLRAELARRYGRRVQVRHIQLATRRAVDEVLRRLAANEDFARIARTYSANTITARDDGLLPPFSREDDDVPRPLRDAAFALNVGDVSGVVRVGAWYHVLKLERTLPAERVALAAVRPELERRLRERGGQAAMPDLLDRLRTQARIEIHDPVLRDAYAARHANVLRER
ncbi:MAG: peptidyl-prolyl cis-trans isomerase [Phycisphaerae bacterium]